MEQARFLSSPQQGALTAISGNLLILAMSLFVTVLIWSPVLAALERTFMATITMKDIITMSVFLFATVIPITTYAIYFWSMIPGAFSISFLSKDEIELRRYFRRRIIRRENVTFVGFERTDRWALRLGLPDNSPGYSEDGLPPRRYKFCIKTRFRGGGDKIQTIRIPLMFPSRAFTLVESWFRP